MKKFLVAIVAMVALVWTAGVYAAADPVSEDPIHVSPKVWVIAAEVDETVIPAGNALDEITAHIAYPFYQVDVGSIVVDLGGLRGEVVDAFADDRGDLVVKFVFGEYELEPDPALTVTINFNDLSGDPVGDEYTTTTVTVREPGPVDAEEVVDAEVGYVKANQ